MIQNRLNSEPILAISIKKETLIIFYAHKLLFLQLESTPMNFIDWIIIILTGLGVAKGFLDGLVRQLVSLSGLILGTWVAIHYSSAAAVFLQKVHEFPEYVWKPLSFLLPFLVTLLLGNLLATIVQRLLSEIGLGPLNHVAGAVFGGMKTVLLLSLILNLLHLFDRNNRLIKTSTLEQSYCYTPVLKVAPALFPYLQKYFKYERDEDPETKNEVIV